MKLVSIDQLISLYPVLLFDSFGVLIHGQGPYPGAVELIDYLNKTNHEYLVLTNTAAELPENLSARFRAMKLQIPPERIVTSGSLLRNYFAAHSLAGTKCIVLGTADSETYVRKAGGEIIDEKSNEYPDAVIVCDESGYPFLPKIDWTITTLIQALEAGKSIHLVFPNPDLIYPSSQNGFGITSGSIAVMIEQILTVKFPDTSTPTFQRLGKPHRSIFEEALQRSGTKNMIMIGDQLFTDIKGANDFGIDSALIESGINSGDDLGSVRPDYLLSSLRMGKNVD